MKTLSGHGKVDYAQWVDYANTASLNFTLFPGRSEGMRTKLDNVISMLQILAPVGDAFSPDF